ncbi:phage tail spike protein [Clostridium vincentii]|uniref:Prophage endopeptidase tail n=1 Tax=Clostridium vincentii TaxID=52704 RepID=A0A2T0BKU0_9CLOT|nr:phage tail spike protein [Clostridium vincentii]PRR84518.1 Prophage endopeptidase tail [Clostridium vincentii]
MICLYDRKTLKGNFNNNGIAILNECIKAEINNELNGDYSLEIEYLANSKKAKYLQEFNIIKADGQLFRIYKVEKIQGNDDRIKIWAKHIFYDLAFYFIENEKAIQCSVKTAMQKAMMGDLFLFYMVDSDIITNNSLEMIEVNPAETMFKIIEQWGAGELYRDNFEIKILNQMGMSTGVLIKYGKNVRGIKITYDATNVVTKLYPKGANGIILSEKYIDVPNWNSGSFPPFPLIKKVEFKDANDEPTLRIMATEAAKAIGLTNVNIEVDFMELSKAKEYENYKMLQEVKVGDFVIVRHSKFNIDVVVEVIKVKKDILVGYNSKVELGQPKSAFDDISKKLQTVKDDLGNMVAKVASSIMYYANTTALSVTTTVIQPIYLGVTAVSSTNLSINLAIYGTASVACTLTINIQLDNKTIPFTPKQKLQAGDNVIGIPLAIPQVNSGAHYLGVFLSTDTGTFTIPLYNLQCLIDGRNLQGGLSSEPPHVELAEKIAYINIKNTSTINTVASFIMDELLNFQISQTVSYFNIPEDKITHSVSVTLA